MKPILRYIFILILFAGTTTGYSQFINGIENINFGQKSKKIDTFGLDYYFIHLKNYKKKQYTWRNRDKEVFGIHFELKLPDFKDINESLTTYYSLKFSETRVRSGIAYHFMHDADSNYVILQTVLDSISGDNRGIALSLIRNDHTKFVRSLLSDSVKVRSNNFYFKVSKPSLRMRQVLRKSKQLTKYWYLGEKYKKEKKLLAAIQSYKRFLNFSRRSMLPDIVKKRYIDNSNERIAECNFEAGRFKKAIFYYNRLLNKPETSKKEEEIDEDADLEEDLNNILAEEEAPQSESEKRANAMIAKCYFYMEKFPQANEIITLSEDDNSLIKFKSKIDYIKNVRAKDTVDYMRVKTPLIGSILYLFYDHYEDRVYLTGRDNYNTYFTDNFFARDLDIASIKVGFEDDTTSYSKEIFQTYKTNTRASETNIFREKESIVFSRYNPADTTYIIYGGKFRNNKKVDLFLDDSVPKLQPFFEEKTKTLYFTAKIDRDDFDIYYSTYRNKKWSYPKNLKSVNTSKNEINPTIGPDNCLYFASQGHKSFGGYDLFKYDFETEKVEPMQLNSTRDDISVTFTLSNKQGYYISNKGVDNIFFKIWHFKYRSDSIDYEKIYNKAYSMDKGKVPTIITNSMMDDYEAWKAEQEDLRAMKEKENNSQPASPSTEPSKKKQIEVTERTVEKKITRTNKRRRDATGISSFFYSDETNPDQESRFVNTYNSGSKTDSVTHVKSDTVKVEKLTKKMIEEDANLEIIEDEEEEEDEDTGVDWLDE